MGGGGGGRAERTELGRHCAGGAGEWLPHWPTNKGPVGSFKYHSLSALNKRSLFSHSPRGLKFKIKTLTRLVSPEASRPGLQVADRLLPAFTRSSLCVCLCPELVFLYGHQSYWISPTLMTSFNLTSLFKDPIGPILGSWGLGLQHMNLSGGHNSACVTSWVCDLGSRLCGHNPPPRAGRLQRLPERTW